VFNFDVKCGLLKPGSHNAADKTNTCTDTYYQ